MTKVPRRRTPFGLAALFMAATLTAGSPTLRAQVFEPYEIAVLRGLDKVTARVSTLEIPVGASVRFEALEIKVRTCRKPPPEDPPESAAFLEVVDYRPDGDVVMAFTGWMFASSPGVSAMDHPVYDVWVLDCLNTPATAARRAAEREAAAEAAAEADSAVE